jgi:hypothetical protein
MLCLIAASSVLFSGCSDASYIQLNSVVISSKDKTYTVLHVKIIDELNYEDWLVGRDEKVVYDKANGGVISSGNIPQMIIINPTLHIRKSDIDKRKITLTILYSYGGNEYEIDFPVNLSSLDVPAVGEELKPWLLAYGDIHVKFTFGLSLV